MQFIFPVKATALHSKISNFIYKFNVQNWAIILPFLRGSVLCRWVGPAAVI